MKAANGFTVLITLTLLFTGCNNYFHDLIPPDENRILSFSVEGMIDRAVISDNAVDATVDNESALSSLLPRIGISHKATLIPLTYEYLKAAFPDADILSEAAAVYEARDISEYVLDLIRRNPNFTVPSLDIPIDFSQPVDFLVVSGRGTIRQYAVSIVRDTGEPRILGFGFSKYDNPELIRDAFTSVNHSAKTVKAAALYPAEMSVSYSLIPSFEIMGDRLEVDRVEIQSGVDSIQFNQALGTQTKTLTVWRNGMSADFALTVDFSEDPDSIRSIIDFRFYKAGNAGIAATAVGSIANNNALGTISVQVFYTGMRPSTLTPSFLSPGTVSVAGVTQVTGVSSHDFSQSIEYRVVSRNNLYTRAYTVVVEFIDVAASAPVFTSFKFSSGLNPELVQDTESQISDSASLIMITARYGGSYPPEMLIPEFRATGIVTVFGSVQTSGFSAQNFSTQIKYTVANPDNSLLKRDYRVQVTFIRDTSSDAKINSFSFHPDENPGLADEIEGRIDQTAGTITVFAPVGSGITSRTMIPRFRASGQVSADGSVQISGSSGHLFDAPVVYEAVSANGVNRKIYTVTMRELMSTMYVNPNAFLGMGDGTSWADAFHDLGTACEAASLFPGDVPKEIWIAAGTYKPSAADREKYFPLTANTSYIGGFAGHEAAKSQRNIAANKTVISGDLGGGVYANNLFGNFNGNTAVTVNGDLFFDGLEFTGANAVNDRGNGAAICAGLSGSSELRITDCDFNNLQANSGAVYVNGGGLAISSASFEDVTSAAYGAVYGIVLSAVRIDNVDLHNISGGGLYFGSCPGDMEINSVNLQEITGNGIYIGYGSGIIGKREFYDITGHNIGGGYGVYVSGGSGDITLTDSGFDNSGIFFDSGGFPVRISGTKVKNVSDVHGIYAYGGNTVIEDVMVENVTNGIGMSLIIANNGALRVSGSTINGVKNSNGSGLALAGSGSVVISNTTIENIEAATLGAIYASMTGDLTIIDSTIDTVVSMYGLYLTGSGNTVISNTAINNVNTSGHAIYAANGRLVIADTTISNITANGIYGRDLSGVQISDLELRSIAGIGLYFINCPGDIEINSVDLQDIANYGICINSGSGKRELSNITGYNIRGSNVYVSWGSGNITLAESNFDTGGQIYLANGSGSINISDTETKNVSGDNAIYTSGGNVVIERVKVENVPNGRGIYMDVVGTAGTGQITGSSIKNSKGTAGGGGICLSGSGSVVISNTTIEGTEAIGASGGAVLGANTGNLTISNSTITNAKTVSHGGGIYYSGSGSVTISETTIEDIETAIDGGGIYAYTSGNLTIRDSTIKNAKAARNGGGIHYSGSGNVTISGTTIEDVETTSEPYGYGGGIYVSSNASQMNLFNTTIKNARASNYGGGLYCYAPTPLVITGSRFENCRSDSAYGGAIYSSPYSGDGSSGEITNTTFLNCTARDGTKISDGQARGLSFKGCIFEDNNSLYRYDPPNPLHIYPMFGFGDTYFENCTFTNLRDVNPGESYIFTRFPTNQTNSTQGDARSTTLIRCTFNFQSGSAGLCAVASGDYLLMDGVTINNNGGQQPLIWLIRWSSDTFYFRLNNVYNGTPLNTNAAITALASSGMMRLTGGAVPTVVP